MIDWKDCSIPGCPNKVCLGLSKTECFVHSPGNKWLKYLRLEWWYRISQIFLFFFDRIKILK